MTLTENTILTVGSMAFDSLRTPAGKADQIVGGSANYFSVAASFFSPVKVVAVVGEDFPKNHLDFLSSRGIDISEVEIAKGKTFHWVGEYGNDLEAKTLSTNLNVFETFNPELSEESKNVPYLFLGNIDPDLQLKVLDQMKNPQIIALDTMNFWITGKSEELKKVLKRVDVLSINESEAKLLSEQENIIQAADIIRNMGPTIVLIKRGEYGASLFTPTGIFLMPGYPISRVIDPTGAGDSFAGALMGYIAQSLADRELLTHNEIEREELLRKAVLAGCVMASFTVEDFGLNRLQHLDTNQIQARLDEMKRIVQIPN